MCFKDPALYTRARARVSGPIPWGGVFFRSRRKHNPLSKIVEMNKHQFSNWFIIIFLQTYGFEEGHSITIILSLSVDLRPKPWISSLNTTPTLNCHCCCAHCDTSFIRHGPRISVRVIKPQYEKPVSSSKPGQICDALKSQTSFASSRPLK